MIARYPLTAAASASPMPVFPDVGCISTTNLDDRGSRRDYSFLLAKLHHALANAVLDGAAGVEELELGDQFALEVAADSVDAHERSSADMVQNVVEDPVAFAGHRKELPVNAGAIWAFCAMGILAHLDDRLVRDAARAGADDGRRFRTAATAPNHVHSPPTLTHQYFKCSFYSQFIARAHSAPRLSWRAGSR